MATQLQEGAPVPALPGGPEDEEVIEPFKIEGVRLRKSTERLLGMLRAKPLTAFSLVCLIYFVFSWGKFFLHATYELLFVSIKRTPMLQKQMCLSRPLMMSVQRHQLERAREELHEDMAISTPSLQRFTGLLDFKFYIYQFGTTDVEIVHPSVSMAARQTRGRTYTAIIYYRLVKAANDRIRNMLYKFAYRNGFHERDYSNCVGKQCRHNSGVQEMDKTTSGRLVNFFLPPTIRRYPFTFVREPLARFISGYKEVEFRLTLAERKGSPNWLAFSSAVGTAERFREFIRFILLHNGSGKLLQYPGAEEFYHVTPFIGTLQRAGETEHTPLRIFRLETMEADWNRLAREVGQPNLWQVWSLQFEPHASMADPFRSAKTAWDFLAPAVNMTLEHYTALREMRLAELQTHSDAVKAAEGGSEDAIEALRADLLAPKGLGLGLGPPKAAPPKPGPRLRPMNPQLASALYLRAICRIYLSDFVCGDYPLPALCSDLHSEVLERSAHVARTERQRRWKRTIVERMAPLWILRLVAEPFCMLLSSSPPECIGRFVVGRDEYDEDNEQETDNDEL